MSPVTVLALLLSMPLNLGAPEKEAKPPRVLRVENGGLLFTDNAAGVSGVDGYCSLPIGSKTLWLFGDAFLLHPTAPAKPWVGDVSNCALLVSHGYGAAPLRHYRFLTDPKTGLARPVLPNRPEETQKTRIWPLGCWYDDAHQAVYAYYSIIKMTDAGGPFGFRIAGYGLARADARDPAALQFTRLKGNDGTDLWGRWEDGVLFGLAVIAGVPDGHVYLIGCGAVDSRRPAKLARVPKSQIEDPGAYEYFAGSASVPRWTKRAADAVNIEGLRDIPSALSVAPNAYLGGYLAVHQVGISEKIRLCLASRPWGPYETIGEIGAPHKAFAKTFCYDGAEHPELAEEGGRIIYITYVDSERYWLQLYKITLQR
jgi:Domain of unknown function (DUF4185)